MKGASGRRGRIRCLFITFIAVILTILLVVALALAVLRPQKPVIRVDSINVEDLKTGIDLFGMKIDLNLTLNVDVSVENPNKFGFKFYDGISQLNYRGLLIGEAPIPDGEISSQETKVINLTLTVMADRLLTSSQLANDVAMGAMPLNTLVRISGSVDIFGFNKFHVASTSSCDFSIGLTNNTVMGNHCHYKTKI